MKVHEDLASAIEELDNAITGYGARIDQLAAARRDSERPVSNINPEELQDER